MFEKFEDIKNILYISDDMFVYGFKVGSDHDQTLNELLQRTKEWNWKNNPNYLVTQTTDIILQ